MEKYEECQNAINNESMENVHEINRAGESHSSKKKNMAMDSFAKDCNSVKTFHDSPRREKVLNNEFRQREHSCPHYLGVTEATSQDSLERVSKIEPYSVIKSHEALKNVSNIEPLATVVNICPNELFTAPHSDTDILKEIHCCEKPIGKKTNFAQRQRRGSKAMAVVEKTGPVDSSYKYLEKRDLLVGNIEERYDGTGVYSKVVCLTSGDEREHLVTSNSILQTGNSSLQTVQSSLQTSDSSLQSGDNWTLNGACKHSLPSNKKPSSDDGLSCRICHSVTDLETLVSPCLCTGSMKYVHESCLLNWLKSSVKTNCELCLHEVPIKKLVKPLREWRFLDEKPVPIIWLLSFLILFTLNILSVIKDASRGCTSTTCIVFYVLGCTGAILGVIFLWFWAKKSAVYFKKLLILNQVWLLDEKYCKTDNKARTSANCNI